MFRNTSKYSHAKLAEKKTNPTYQSITFFHNDFSAFGFGSSNRLFLFLQFYMFMSGDKNIIRLIPEIQIA